MPTSARVVGATGAIELRRGGALPLPCHSEPVTDVTGVGIRDPMPKKKERIATPVCGLARNDIVGADAHIGPHGGSNRYDRVS